MKNIQINIPIIWLDDKYSINLECSYVNEQDTNGKDEIWCYFNNCLLCRFNDLDKFDKWFHLTTGTDYRKYVVKKKIYVDMDGVLCDFMTPYTKNINNLEYQQSELGFFINLEPIKDAINSINILSEYYDVWFLTKPSTKNLHSYTEKAEWIKKYFGEHYLDKLILSPDKSLLIGDFLIDDDTKANQLYFEGEFIHFGSSNYPNWIYVVNHLLKLKNPKLSTEERY
jgi:5'-nucleotidase